MLHEVSENTTVIDYQNCQIAKTRSTEEIKQPFIRVWRPSITKSQGVRWTYLHVMLLSSALLDAMPLAWPRAGPWGIFWTRRVYPSGGVGRVVDAARGGRGLCDSGKSVLGLDTVGSRIGRACLSRRRWSTALLFAEQK